MGYELRQMLLDHPDFMMKTLNCALDILDLYTYDAANASYNNLQVSKQLGLLKDEQIIATKRGYIEILDPDELVDYCSYDVMK